ncbi:hypothetical protein ACFLX7_01055 [Chloroflexota bacterium]
MDVRLKSSTSKIEGSSTITAILVLCGGILLLFWDIFNGALIPAKGIALILASVGYLLIRKRIPSNLKMATSPSLLGKSSVSLILNILFLIAFSYTLITVASSKVYSIPITYFISTAVVCLIITLDIFSMPSEKTAYTKIILLKIIALSLLLIWIPYYKFLNMGVDPWYHMQFIREVLIESHIPSIGHQYYKDFAAMHLIVAGVKIITGLAIKNSMMFIGSIGVISLLTTFCLGKILFNEKVGLLAALFLGFSNDFIFWGYYVIPMSLGISLVMVLIYLVIKGTIASPGLATKFLFLVLALVLVYTHTIATLVFLIMITSLYLSNRLSHTRAKRRLPVFLSYSTLFFFGVVVTAYWLYISGFLVQTVVPTIARAFSFPAYEFAYPNLPVNITPILLNSIGLMFLMGFGAVAVLYYWNHRHDYQAFLMLIAAGFGPAIFIYSASLTGQDSILLPDRWEVFILVPLSMVAASGVFLVYHSFRSQLLKILSLILIVLILSFSMISTSLYGHSNPLRDKDRSVRGFFFDSEIVAAEAITNYYEGEITSDLFYITYLEATHDKEVDSIYYSFLSSDEPEVTNAIVVRKYILNYIFRTQKPQEAIMGYGSFSVRLDEAQKDKVTSLNEDQRYNKIYGNNEVVVYLPYSMKKGE